jgi:uncharacterized repeat protein (TIGR03806 family)
MFQMLNSAAARVTGSLLLILAFLGAIKQTSAMESAKTGIETRVPWTTSKVVGTPEPPLPFITERAFPAISFNRCLDITNAPGSDRLFVVEQSGKIFSFVNRPDVQTADLVVDLSKEISSLRAAYAIAFHPNFEQNRYCYVCYIEAPSLPNGTHVVRLKMSDTDPPTIDASTETPIVTWLSGGHNGCCLKFGPDGYLYISTGDGGPANPPDPNRVGQDLSNLLSSILRIDVDHTDGEQNYRIPADNPFVDLDGARGEVWAFGLRNPWRMSFDQKTGDLWVGDVGWELWEMLDRIERGGNYGWSVQEGQHAVNPEWPRGPTEILPPTIDHPHSESSSITEGLTYYGKRIPELSGTHIYGDYDTGKMWGFRYEKGQVVNHRELADTTHRIVGFGKGQEGEAYLLDHIAGTIHRLVPNPVQDRSTQFPRKLSETGLFSSVAQQKPAPGVVPYSINAEPWADHAVAQRFVAVPKDLSINTKEAKWSFPEGTVFVKTLSLDMTQGDSTARRLVETQLLHFDGREWMPYAYRWNDEQSDATLVDATGAEQTFNVIDPNSTGGVRQQAWRFAGRAECQRCHNRWSGPPLAFDTPQLNREHDYGNVTASQLDTFAHIGLIEKPIPTTTRPRLADPRNSAASIDARARAYLQVNCAHCHRVNAGGAVLSKMHYDIPLSESNMLGERPSQGTFGIHAAKVIAPGDPFASVLYYRMAKLGGGRMPHIGSTEVDRAGVELIHDWIQQLPGDEGSGGSEIASKLRAESVALLKQLQATRQAAEQTQLVERLLSTTDGALRLLQAIDRNMLPDVVASQTVKQSTQQANIVVRDLFERFLAPDQRVKRLGSVVHADQILSLTGDASQGKRVFFETDGVACKSCHRIHQDGKEVGPELTTIGKKQTRAELLESILEPSKRIDNKFVTYVVETVDGRVLTGLIVSRDKKEVVLRDATNKLLHVAVDEIEQLVTRQQSLMPDLLLRDMTAQQVADLLAYLGSLK